jgi:hypothetical protein
MPGYPAFPAGVDGLPRHPERYVPEALAEHEEVLHLFGGSNASTGVVPRDVR